MRRVTTWYSFWIVILEGILFASIYIWRIDIPCYFETIYKIPCPLCYMTQAMDYLLAGNVEKAVLTNPLIVVLLPLGIIINLICMLDFCTLFKHNHMKRFIQKVILRWWSVGIIALGWLYVLIYH